MKVKLMSILSSLLFVAVLVGCASGPPDDNSEISEPAAPPPPGGAVPDEN